MGESTNQYIKIYWVLYAVPIQWCCTIGNCSQKSGRLTHKHIGRACFNLHPFFLHFPELFGEGNFFINYLFSVVLYILFSSSKYNLQQIDDWSWRSQIKSRV